MKDYSTLRTSSVEFRDLRLSPTGTTESRAEGVLTVLSPLSVQINDLSFFLQIIYAKPDHQSVKLSGKNGSMAI